MKKKALEIKLQELKPYSSNVELEQYNTPATIASDVLYTAYSLQDIKDKGVIDLGCGNGMFAVGAKLLGAKEAIGVDLDENAIEVAKQNMERAGVEVDFVSSDVTEFSGSCDTVIQNPPFGAQKAHKHADVVFLKKAFEIANVVYSLHLSRTESFVLRNFNLLGGKVTLTKSYKFPILYTYPFHKKEKKNFDVIMVRGDKHGEI